MKTKYSQDKNYYYEIYEKNNLYRIRYYINYNDDDKEKQYTQVCGTNSSIFDDIALAEKEADRMLKKYEDHPTMYRK